MARIVESENVLDGCFRSYLVTTETQIIDVIEYLQTIKPDLTNFVVEFVETEKSVKFQLHLCVRFTRALEENAQSFFDAYFNNKQIPILNAGEVENVLTTVFGILNDRALKFQSEGSSWTVSFVRFAKVHFARYSPWANYAPVEQAPQSRPQTRLNAVAGSSYCDLPLDLLNKRALINVQNSDTRCFMWSILSALHPVQSHAERVSNYSEFTNELNFSGIAFPVSYNDYARFEKLNPVSITVYGYDEGVVHPVYITRKPGCSAHVDLLLIETPNTLSHYCWVKHKSRLLFNVNKHRRKKYFCPLCLSCFYDPEVLKQHQLRCTENAPQIEMPEKPILKFENHCKMQRRPYAIYADTECLLEPVAGCSSDPQQSYTRVVSNHVPCAIGFIEVLKGCENETARYGKVFLRAGKNCVSLFIEQLISCAEAYMEWIDRRNRELRMSDAEEIRFNDSWNCAICRQPIRQMEIKVRHHCHPCGSFIGAAHQICNLQCRNNNTIPVLFHNLRRYDGHIIMQQIGKVARERKLEIECIPKNLEDYIAFSLKKRGKFKLNFLDSYQFLSASLETLVNALVRSNANGLEPLKAVFPDPEQNQLLCRKGVMPYEYFTSWSTLNESHLPSRSSFYSSPTDSDVSEDDYAHAENVWRVFGCQKLLDYLLIYLKSDIVILAAVFEAFREFGMKHYGPDPCNYVTLPSYSMDACLLITQAKVELLTDQTMYEFFEKGIRGGVSMIVKRFAKANNSLCSSYDPTQPTSWLFYCDENNLYGWAMCQPLPYSDFEWVKPSAEILREALNAPDDGPIGYTLQVDLVYPAELHDAHNDFPLAAEKMKITKEILSPYSKNLANEFGTTMSEKPVNTFLKKTDYIVDYTNLKFYLQHGLKITKLSKVVRYKQKPWIREYVELNTRMRAQTQDEYEKTLFKTMNNSLYGKQLENCTSLQDRAIRYQRGVFPQRSKGQMDKFHYDFIIPTYGKNAQLCHTDTDSFVYHIFTENLYTDLGRFRDMFDFSDYPHDHPLWSDKNKKKMGVMKDEANGRIIEEFVGLRSKMYSIKMSDANEIKRAKGVSRSIVKKKLTHEMYKRVLFSSSRRRDEQQRIAQSAHHLTTTAQNKVSLSAFDDKRFILNGGISTLAYGHYSIPDHI